MGVMAVYLFLTQILFHKPLLKGEVARSKGVTEREPLRNIPLTRLRRELSLRESLRQKSNQWQPPQVEQSWVQLEGISPVMAKVMVLFTAFISSLTAS